jgi:hypothetical protein
MENEMRTAICFTGTGRSLEYTGENLKKVLIQESPNCDVFVHIAKTKHSKKAEKYFTIDQVKDFKIENDELISTDGLRWHPNWPMGLHSGNDPKQTYLNMLLSRMKCGQMLTKYSNKNSIKYDKVIFSRLDIEYFYNLPKNMDLKYICVPDFHHFDIVQGKGCNDRFAAGNFENMMAYFNLYGGIRDLVKRGHRLHGESTLYSYLNLCNIQIKKYFIRFTRIRPDGFRQDERLQRPSLELRDH